MLSRRRLAVSCFNRIVSIWLVKPKAMMEYLLIYNNALFAKAAGEVSKAFRGRPRALDVIHKLLNISIFFNCKRQAFRNSKTICDILRTISSSQGSLIRHEPWESPKRNLKVSSHIFGNELFSSLY
jgi:hypothetical protein